MANISAKEAAHDIKAGMSDSALLAKYGISANALPVLFNRLLEKRAITQDDLDNREGNNREQVPPGDTRPVKELDKSPESGTDSSAIVISKDLLYGMASAWLRPFVSATRGPKWSPNQRLLAAAVTRSWEAFFPCPSWRSHPIVPSAGCLIVGSVPVYCIIWLASFLGSDWILLSLCAGILGSCYLIVRFGGQEQDVNLEIDENGRFNKLRLGRLDGVIDVVVVYTHFFFLAVIVGSAQGLVLFTSDHMSVPGVNGFWDAASVTLKLVLHFPLDFVNLYVANIGGPVTKNLPPFPATVMTIYRLACDAVLVFGGYNLIQRHRVKKVFAKFPRGEDNDGLSASDQSKALLDWMANLARDHENLGRKFHDEIIFTLIAEAYLRGKFELVKEMSCRFVSIEVDNYVRRLFVHPETKEVLFVLKEPRKSWYSRLYSMAALKVEAFRR